MSPPEVFALSFRLSVLPVQKIPGISQEYPGIILETIPGNIPGNTWSWDQDNTRRGIGTRFFQVDLG